jgi:hypothetical protein
VTSARLATRAALRARLAAHPSRERTDLAIRLRPRIPPTARPRGRTPRRTRQSRASQARHLPSSAFRTPSTAFTPQPRPGLFHPGNAPGVVVFRALLRPGGPRPSRGRGSLAVAVPAFLLACEARRGSRRLQSVSHQAIRTATGRKPTAAVALLTFAPLRPSPPPGLDRLLRPRARARDRFSPTHPPVPFALFEGARASECPTRRHRHLLPCERRRPFWGLPPLPERTLASPSRFR